MALLLLCHATALVAWLTWILKYEVPLNAADITANGNQDNLKAGYHRRRSWARFWPWLALSLLGSSPYIGSFWAYVVSSAGLGALLACVFLRTFNSQLSKARGLDPYYVSKDKHAAWIPDRILHELGWRLKPVLNAALLLGLLAEAVGLWASWRLL